MKRKLVITLFAGLLMLTACTLQIQAPANGTTATFGKAWTATPCETLDVAPAIAEIADCGYVTVPEKRGESGLALGDKNIQLGVARLKSTAKRPGTPIVVGTGGPGGEGLLLVLTRAYAGGIKVQELYKAVLADRDLVFFTQRGTKSAKPELNCAEFDALSYKAAVAGWSQVEIEAQYLATAQACAAAAVAQGIDLSAYNSNENADDIVDIKQALGYTKIIYYGQSYGTLLGQFLMRRHPDSLEAVILDGVVPAAIPMYSQVIDVPAAFQRVFTACAADTNCNANYPNLAAALDEVAARLKATPASVEVAQTDGATVTVKINDVAILGGLFPKIYQGGADVPATIYQLKANDFATLAAFAPTPDDSRMAG
ncbi:MAG: alpha/beta fold hydrolase [Chloroflexi bacterium]|nr:alpha/beta fold hydrolase [Chloroflexota bacterium]